MVLRTQLFDRLTTQFLSAHPSGLCIALGAGLCTRRSRLAALAGTARWLNVDLPDAIALRDQYMDGDETRLACSILDTSWLDAAALPGSQPVLVLLEGVCPYLPQAPLEAMLQQLAQRFAAPGSPPCTVVLDHVHPALARLPMQVGGMRLPSSRALRTAPRWSASTPPSASACRSTCMPGSRSSTSCSRPPSTPPPASTRMPSSALNWEPRPLPEPAAPDLFADAFRWHEKFLSPCSRATAFADQRT